MASIYKRKQDASVKRAPWYIGYTTELGKRRTVKGFSDKSETERLAARLEHEVMLRKRGLIDPEQERLAEKRKTPLADHLEAFKKSLGSNTDKHVKLTLSRVRKIIAALHAETISDLTTEAVEDALRQIALDDDLGNRTYNHYVQAIDEFCRWMQTTKRAATNVVLGLERLNSEVDVRHRRRALAPAEIQQLIQSARESGKRIQGISGEIRARIYILAYMTGLRRVELGSLTPFSFDLKSAQPTVTVEAAFSKHRRRDVLPLHPELVLMLREWLKGFGRDKYLFPNLGKKKTWFMVKKDLERVGIEYETQEGIADFHAAGRHTHITELLRNGTSLPEAKELARHRDIKMTMRYTHIGMEDQAKAIKNLPWQPKAEENPNPGEEEAWERPGSESGVGGCHQGALDDPTHAPSLNDETPVVTGVVATSRHLASNVKSGGGGNRTSRHEFSKPYETRICNITRRTVCTMSARQWQPESVCGISRLDAHPSD